MPKQICEPELYSLTNHEYQIVIGSLLGDGGLRLGCLNSNPSLKIQRAQADYRYLEYQYESLRRLCTDTGIKSGSILDPRTDKAYHYCRFQTRSIPALLPLYRDWYPAGKKLVPRNFELTPLISAVWFADDGRVCRSGKSELKWAMATDGFSKEDTVYLADKLTLLLGVKFNPFLKGASKAGQEQYAIYATSEAAYAFIKYIQPVFGEFHLDRKMVWLDIDLDFPPQLKRSVKYYTLAPVVLSTPHISARDLVAANIYRSKTASSDTLLLFYRRGYFTRAENPLLKQGREYLYSLTCEGEKFFSSLLREQQLLLNNGIDIDDLSCRESWRT